MMRWLALICTLVAAHTVRAVETLRPQELQPGMKGYGLSVFHGTEPERFEVEILGVLPNVFPQQDMILIRMSGANLQEHKVIAGMSGSPIYIQNKLIGALAYGWSFENEPLAGVTPIHNMLAEIDRPSPKSVAAGFSLRSEKFGERGPGPGSAGNPTFASLTESPGPRPMLTPLSLGGFSPATLRLFAEKFEQFGLLPLAVGGFAGPIKDRPRGKIVPGGAIGVELIRGDLNAIGVGTATYVAGQRILAFGHPFFQGGQFVAPAVQAQVHTIMSSLATSFKMATAVASVGALVGDWESCIVADTGVEAPMIPLTVEAVNKDTGQARTYHIEIVDNEAFSPLFAQLAIAEAVVAASASSQETMVQVELTAETATRTVRLANTFFNPAGGLYTPWAWSPLSQIFSTPFGRTRVKRIHAKVIATQTRQTAVIKGAYFSKSEADRGERLPLTVVVKPYDQPETNLTVLVKAPAATESLRVLTVVVVAGGTAPTDAARPDSVNSFLDALEKKHRQTDLVTLVRLPTEGLQYRGKLLKNLPPSALTVLDDAGHVDITGAADVDQIVTPTAWVLSGSGFAQIPIREE